MTIHTQLAYGAAPVIGVIELSTSVAITVESQLVVPDDIVVVSARLRLPGGKVSAATLGEMTSSTELERAAQQVADAGAQVIAFACTTGSLLGGPGFDTGLAERMTAQTGVPALTTATAVVRALRRVGATSIAVGTPNIDELNVLEQEFFEAAGFEVRHIEGLQIGEDRDISRLTAAEVRALAESSMRDGVDALFLSCTNMPTVPLLADLEDQFGVPVISSNSATLWAALEAIDAPARSTRLGGQLAGLQGAAR